MDEIAQEDGVSGEVDSAAADTNETGVDSGDVDGFEQVTETIGDEAQVSFHDLVDDDFSTALKMGALPLAILGILLIIAAIVYFVRKKSAWTEDDLGSVEDDSAKDPDNDLADAYERSVLKDSEPTKKL